ncbi:hypothetical protein [Microvirga sesbaniae]|uniref:hypothetical protein n=1 Tax=Microvirga sesbaniae TaxID=681392 RepID=UPI0021CA6F78|nr:hypothetical protein [Microvirga sp. HBU67692]
MRIVYASHSDRAGTRWTWSAMLRLAVLITAALALLAITLVGLFVVLPLVIASAIALSFFRRRRLRQAQHRLKGSVIDADYTLIVHQERCSIPGSKGW